MDLCFLWLFHSLRSTLIWIDSSASISWEWFCQGKVSLYNNNELTSDQIGWIGNLSLSCERESLAVLRAGGWHALSEISCYVFDLIFFAREDPWLRRRVWLGWCRYAPIHFQRPLWVCRFCGNPFTKNIFAINEMPLFHNASLIYV